MRNNNQRQRTRKIMLYISFLLFPVTYYYFSPYLIIEGASKGIITGSFILFTTMFLSSLFVGRLFCGWVCPAAGLQRLCLNINDGRFKVGRRDWFKYIVWFPWVSLIFFMLVQAAGVKSINPIYQTYYGISVQNMGSLILYLVIAGGIMVITISAGKRGFCHYLCWMAPFMIIGRRIRNMGKWFSLRLIADEAKCIDCLSCSKNCLMSLNVNEMVKSGNMENSECILCGTCIDVCPLNVISYSFSA